MDFREVMIEVLVVKSSLLNRTDSLHSLHSTVSLDLNLQLSLLYLHLLFLDFMAHLGCFDNDVLGI